MRRHSLITENNSVHPILEDANVIVEYSAKLSDEDGTIANKQT